MESKEFFYVVCFRVHSFYSVRFYSAFSERAMKGGEKGVTKSERGQASNKAVAMAFQIDLNVRISVLRKLIIYHSIGSI